MVKLHWFALNALVLGDITTDIASASYWLSVGSSAFTQDGPQVRDMKYYSQSISSFLKLVSRDIAQANAPIQDTTLSLVSNLAPAIVAFLDALTSYSATVCDTGYFRPALNSWVNDIEVYAVKLFNAANNAAVTTLVCSDLSNMYLRESAMTSKFTNIASTSYCSNTITTNAYSRLTFPSCQISTATSKPVTSTTSTSSTPIPPITAVPTTFGPQYDAFSSDISYASSWISRASSAYNEGPQTRDMDYYYDSMSYALGAVSSDFANSPVPIDSYTLAMLENMLYTIGGYLDSITNYGGSVCGAAFYRPVMGTWVQDMQKWVAKVYGAANSAAVTALVCTDLLKMYSVESSLTTKFNTIASATYCGDRIRTQSYTAFNFPTQGNCPVTSSAAPSITTSYAPTSSDVASSSPSTTSSDVPPSSAPTSSAVPSSSAPTSSDVPSSSAPTSSDVPSSSAPTSSDVPSSSAPTSSDVPSSSAPTSSDVSPSSAFPSSDAPSSSDAPTSSVPTSSGIASSADTTPAPSGPQTHRCRIPGPESSDILSYLIF